MHRLTIAVAAALACAQPAGAAELLGRAVLPAATFAPGPTSGQFITGANGVAVPFANKQTVQGFSGVVPGPVPGTYDFIIDNGFGAKANSADSLLRVFALKPDFTTGTVTPVDFKSGQPTTFDATNWFITLSDPRRLLGYTAVADATNYPNGPATIAVDPAIKAGRLLTGADFDVEGVVRAPDGSFWFGEEFGPFIFHTGPRGKLLREPTATRNRTGFGDNTWFQSPDYPTPIPGSHLPQFYGLPYTNARSSGGYEGFTINPRGTLIYATLEKAISTDPDQSRRIISVYSIPNRRFTTTTYAYKVGDPDGNDAGIDPTGNSIGDMNMINDHQILVIERDGGQGSTAKFKRVYLADLSVIDAGGFVKKTLVADLMNIADPNNRGGNGTTGGVFTFPFVTIEDIIAVSRDTILVVNDNNFPFSSGRTPGQPDDDEMALIKLDTPLDVVCGAANAVPCGR